MYLHESSTRRGELQSRPHGIRAFSAVPGLRAPQHGNRRSTHAARDHELPQLGQPRPGLDLAPVLARRVLPSGPQHLACRAGTRPDERVHVHRVDGLGPDRHLAAEDQLGLLGRQVGRRVVLVDQGPALGRGAPVIEGVEGFERRTVSEVQPRASAAVEVLFRVSNPLVQFCACRLGLVVQSLTQ